MELTRQQLRALKQYYQCGVRRPTVGWFLLHSCKAYLLLGVFMAVWTLLVWPLGIGPVIALLAGSILLGVVIRDIGYCRAFLAAWPAVEEVIDWPRVVELIQLNDPNWQPTQSVRGAIDRGRPRG